MVTDDDRVHVPCNTYGLCVVCIEVVRGNCFPERCFRTFCVVTPVVLAWGFGKDAPFAMGVERFMCKQMLSRRCFLSQIPLLAITLIVCICTAVIGDITRDSWHRWRWYLRNAFRIAWYTFASNISIEGINHKS